MGYPIGDCSEEKHGLMKKERQVADVQKRMFLGHAAFIIGTMDSLVERISYASFGGLPERWGEL